MKPEPTLREKIASLASAEEVEGFRQQMERDGRMNQEVVNLLAMLSAAMKRKV